ncbi:MAG TPA: hypothetical protein HPP94_11500 [Desulfuromonadales bacterium]|nr:hypothetical protein [Desulfuromonadales bacterium]
MTVHHCVEQRYEDAYESIHAALIEQVRQNPAEAARTIRKTLTSLYVRQGNDWTGRGDIGNAGINATIAAHECVLAEVSHQLLKQ